MIDKSAGYRVEITKYLLNERENQRQTQKREPVVKWFEFGLVLNPGSIDRSCPLSFQSIPVRTGIVKIPYFLGVSGNSKCIPACRLRTQALPSASLGSNPGSMVLLLVMLLWSSYLISLKWS